MARSLVGSHIKSVNGYTLEIISEEREGNRITYQTVIVSHPANPYAGVSDGVDMSIPLTTVRRPTLTERAVMAAKRIARRLMP